jgi:predicted TIM-barrel fold metal-dependent hydrolase
VPGSLVIDAHMHIWDPAWLPEGLRRAWARQGAGRRFPERDPQELLPRVATGESDPDAALTVRAFDRAGVAAGLIPVVDWTIVGSPAGEHLPIIRLNEQYEDVCTRNEGRLYFAAGIDPRHSDAPDILDLALAHPHCHGVKLYPAAGWDLRDPAHEWLFATLVERDVPVIVHCSPLGGDPLQVSRSRPAEVAALMALNPTLRVSFAHAGIEAWWAEALDCATGWQHAYLELSLWQRLAGRDYGEFRQRVAQMREQLGAHRLVFGSDIVRGTKHDPDGDELVRWVELARGLAEPYGGSPAVFAEEELELFLAGNAIRLYDLKEFS